ncbi:hypothetical protein CIRG_00373 [Coccidioides immitis RMSCC 2394]|uniref:Uncharacterized protein n=1 Tax=Coccidioides immitis RMSCC 2394 TaxID=404692 RepID=A0A0J6XVM1_COCIT|nr:hypothetical protein CIRG_00373 [Coccidioides immitis RMSCC 2394]
MDSVLFLDEAKSVSVVTSGVVQLGSENGPVNAHPLRQSHELAPESAKLAGWQQILAGKQRRGPSAIRPWSLRRTGVAFAACFSNQRPADGVMSGWRLMALMMFAARFRRPGSS